MQQMVKTICVSLFILLMMFTLSPNRDYLNVDQSVETNQTLKF